MAKAERDLKIRLELTESEANDLFIHLNPKYVPNNCHEIKKEIARALGYEPKETPNL